MAAPVTDFTSFTAQLNLQFGPGSDEVVTGHIGRNLTRAGAWGQHRYVITYPVTIPSNELRIGDVAVSSVWFASGCVWRSSLSAIFSVFASRGYGLVCAISTRSIGLLFPYCLLLAAPFLLFQLPPRLVPP